MKRSLLLLLALVLSGTTAMLGLLAQVGNPFADIGKGGTDGDLAPAGDVVIDLV